MFQLCSGAGDGSCLYGKGVPGKSQRQVAWGTDSASQADGLEVAVCGEGGVKKKHFWQQWVAKDAMQSFTVKLFYITNIHSHNFCHEIDRNALIIST